jgi:hypothetical protein
VGQKLGAKAHAQNRLPLRKNSTQQLDFTGEKRVAWIPEVPYAHGSTHDDQDVVVPEGCWHGRFEIEPQDVGREPMLQAQVRDVSGSFPIEVLENDGPSHGTLSAVIR